MSEAPETKPAPAVDQSPAAIAASALLISLYGLGALVLIGISLYFAVVQKVAITEPRVFVGLLGALYLGVRGYMMFNKRSKKAGNAR